MPGFGDDSVHRTYDEVAAELRKVVAGVTTPLAAAARKRRLGAEKALRLERDEVARLNAGEPGPAQRDGEAHSERGC